MDNTKTECIHHWNIETTPFVDKHGDRMFNGICKICGTKKIFPAFITYSKFKRKT